MLDALKPTPDPIESAAHRILDHPESYSGLRPLDPKDTILRLIENPSQTWYPVSVWLLQLDPDSALVRRVEWDRNSDRRFPKAAPHTFGTDAEIPREEAAALIEDLHSISISPFRPLELCIDGGLQTVEFWGRGTRVTSVSWWGDRHEWRQLVDWYSRARTLFENYLPVRTARNQLSNPEPDRYRGTGGLRQGKQKRSSTAGEKPA